MRYCQLLLFPRPPPPARLRHRWIWYPGFNQCARCGRLWYSGHPRAWMIAALASGCYGPLRSSLLRQRKQQSRGISRDDTRGAGT